MLTNIQEPKKDDPVIETLKRPAFLNKSARKWIHAPLYQYQSSSKNNPSLQHWVPCNKLADNVYPFAKLDKHVEIIHFDKEQYENFDLCAQDWSFDETQILFKICKQYELKFYVIHDRYNQAVIDAKRNYRTRSIEELKHRFYTVDKILKKSINLVAEEELPPAYDIQHEIKRKQLLKKYYSRTVDEIAEEAFLINELKRIQTKQKEMDKIRVDTNELLVLADEYIKNRATIEQNKTNSKLNKATKSSQLRNNTNESYNDQHQFADNFNPRTAVSSTSRKRIASGSNFRKKKLKSASSTNQLQPVASPKPPTSSAATNTANPPKSGGVGSRTRIIEPFKNAGVHIRSQKMIQTHNIGMKRVKMLEQVCIDLGLDTYPPPTEEIYGILVELRSQILTLFDLKHALGVALYDNHMLRNKHLPTNESNDISIVEPTSPTQSIGDSTSFTLPDDDKSFSNILDSMVSTAISYQRKRKSSLNKSLQF